MDQLNEYLKYKIEMLIKKTIWKIHFCKRFSERLSRADDNRWNKEFGTPKNLPDLGKEITKNINKCIK